MRVKCTTAARSAAGRARGAFSISIRNARGRAGRHHEAGRLRSPLPRPCSRIVICTGCLKLRFSMRSREPRRTPSCRVRPRFCAWLRDWVRTRPRARKTKVPLAPDAARHRIDADPAAPVTLIELARDSGVSRYQLIRAFAQVGLTPHAYILQRRIALAQRLIRAAHTTSRRWRRLRASTTRVISRAGSCGSSA